MRTSRSARHLSLTATLALAAPILALTLPMPALAKHRMVQLAEDSAITEYLPPAAAKSLRPATTEVCAAGARWMRIGFKDLELYSYDSLLLTSSEGDSVVFEGSNWNERSFYTRALRGSCVRIEPYFGDKRSIFEVDRYQSGSKDLAATTVVVAGAGDICNTSGDACKRTSDKIIEINPTAIFTAGDNVYQSGTLSEYTSRYQPTWGRFKVLTHPTPGNHDYLTSGARGYYDYFNGSGVQTGPAGNRSLGYYSWDVGDWHFVMLNTQSGGSVASAQLSWLDQDLAANTKPCTAAVWHHPLVSRGNYSGYSQVKPFWDRLYAAKADLVLVGHDHNYQRYAKMNPSQAAAADGLTQVLVGTGGRSFYSLSGTHPRLVASNANTHGVLKLTLTATGFTGDFVPAAPGSSSSGTYTDHFTGTCNRAGTPVNQPPVANFTLTTSGLTASFTDTSTDSDGTIAARSWNFGDGSAASTTNPTRTYAAAGTYTVTLTVTDNAGATHSVSKTVTVSTNTQPSFFENTTDFAIRDNTTISSPISVAGRSGNAPSTLQVGVRILHTYIGDLKVDLLAPDGSVYVLHNRSGSGADNIIRTFTVNASSEGANGTWTLRVNDNAAQDIGTLDSWSLQF